jgi:hypothetical protein
LTERSDVGQFSFMAREAAQCDGARFHLDIAPEWRGVGFFDHEPYSKTIAFDLPALAPPPPILGRRRN